MEDAGWYMSDVKVKGVWFYLYRAIDTYGDTVEFYFTANRDLAGCEALSAQGSGSPWQAGPIILAGSQTNRVAIIQCDAEKRLGRPEDPSLSDPANT